MKPVYKCEYCNHMGTEEDVRKHEVECLDNYDRRSCFTCEHKSLAGLNKYKCAVGREIPEGKIFEFCGDYERKEKTPTPEGQFADLFGGLFGGI